ncbi:MAG: type 1 glutamine amidotransferase, partial [Bacteroidota bacterium]
MRISYLQHTKSEGPGYIAEWAENKGHELTGYNMINGDMLPAIDNFDWLIVLGGPMSIDEIRKYPWLKDEKTLISEAMKKKKVVIGICLGAQMMAEALGGRVFKSPLKEIGWYPIQMTHHATSDEIF